MLFFLNWPTKDWVNWRDFQNFSFSIIEVIEKRQKWQFFGSEWQISINVEDQIRLWRLYFWAWINRRGDTAIRYFRVRKKHQDVLRRPVKVVGREFCSNLDSLWFEFSRNFCQRAVCIRCQKAQRADAPRTRSSATFANEPYVFGAKKAQW